MNHQMPKVLLYIFMLVALTGLKSQNNNDIKVYYDSEKAIVKYKSINDKGDTVVNEIPTSGRLIYEANGEKDTLISSISSMELLDYSIFSDTLFAVIIEDVDMYSYLKYRKIKGKWEREITSGNIAKTSSSGKWLYNNKIKHSFKIISIDLISYKYGDEEIIINCKDFEEKYFERKRLYEEYLKNKSEREH